MVQLATYVGYRLHKTPGAVLAAVALIVPAFFLMLGLSFLYFKYGQLSWVKSVSQGLHAVVIALLLQALWRLEENVRRHWLDFGIALAALGSLWLGMNYLLIFLGAGALRLMLGWGFSTCRLPTGGFLRPRPRTGSCVRTNNRHACRVGPGGLGLRQA